MQPVHPNSQSSPRVLQVQLSCYGDAINGNLKGLKAFLDTKVQGALLQCLHKLANATHT